MNGDVLCWRYFFIIFLNPQSEPLTHSPTPKLLTPKIDLTLTPNPLSDNPELSDNARPWWEQPRTPKPLIVIRGLEFRDSGREPRTPVSDPWGL